MQQIADWLEKLGMSEYAQRFAESDIDASVLRDLTDQDLKELGVSLGHRRKMLRSIAELADEASPQPALTEPKPKDTAERRQVTVMFSDLVGSTAMSARMHPEELREVVSAYQKRVAESVQRFGGFVAKYMGDGVLIYFGYPFHNVGAPTGASRHPMFRKFLFRELRGERSIWQVTTRARERRDTPHASPAREQFQTSHGLNPTLRFLDAKF